jgi:hypothetical protein
MVNLYAALADKAELTTQVMAAQRLDKWGEKQASERLQRVLRTDYPTDSSCGSVSALVSFTEDEGQPKIAIPSLLRARVSANESATIGDLRTIQSAEAAFESQFGHYGTLSNLVWPPYDGPRFIDESLMHGGETRHGYRYNLQLDWGDSPRIASLSPLLAAPRSTFQVFACPEKPGVTGVRYFLANPESICQAHTVISRRGECQPLP